MSNPTLRIYDCQLAEGQTQGEMIVRVEAFTGYSFPLRVFYSGNLGLLTKSGYHPIFLHRGVEELRIPFSLKRPLRPGETTYLALPHDSLWGAWDIVMGDHGDGRPADRALISLKDEGRKPPPLKGWGKSVEAGERYTKPEAVKGYKLAFHSNLIDGFKATDSGFDEAGKPCWKTQMGHGRAQIHNGEVGLYTDPALHGTSPFQIEDGKRVLVAEKLAKPLEYKGKTWEYSAPMLTTETLFRTGYGWLETRVRCNGARGSWPAFWAKCSPHWVWPPELDVFEINHGDGNPFFTQWNGRGDGSIKRGFKPSDPTLGWLIGKPYRQDELHTYALHWTEEFVEWYLDDVLLMSQPNFNKLGEIAGADQDGRMYLKLNVAMGGQGGKPDGSTAKMWVDYVSAYAPEAVEKPEPKPEPPQPQPEEPPVPEPGPDDDTATFRIGRYEVSISIRDTKAK